MNGHMNDFDALSAVPPRALYAYIKAQGWRRVEPFGEAGDVYALEEDGPELLVPASSAFADYAPRISQIIEILSSLEERDGSAILRDLALADVDLVRVRVPEAMADGSIPIDRGVTLFQESRNLLLAAACSATRPQRLFRAGRVREAMDYLGTVRMGQTERGSFVISLLSPAPPELVGQVDFFDNLPSEPFPRRVTRTLASGLQAARRAVDLANRGRGIGVFEERVPEGISANLCDALGGLLGDEKELDVSISWALTRKPPGERLQMRFCNSDMAVLMEASRILKEHQDRPDERIDGYVTALARGESAHEGRATIKAMVDEVMKSIRVDFKPDDYSRIAEAHDNRRVVSLEGDLKRDGQRWALLNPRDITVIPDEW